VHIHAIDTRRVQPELREGGRGGGGDAELHKR
jgi:hypothetical protein